MNNISGKKEIIFDEAVKLISVFGFEAVNLRQLAKLSGIKAASIYNHFSSKQEILDCIYSYYIEHFMDNYKPESEVMKIIETGSKNEIIDALTFTFETEDIKKYQRLVLTTQIIYTRVFTDKKAGEIFFNIMLNDREVEVKRVLDYGISIGKFKSFDTKTFSSLLCGSRHMMGIRAFGRVDYKLEQLPEEDELKVMFAELIPLNDKYSV